LKTLLLADSLRFVRPVLGVERFSLSLPELGFAIGQGGGKPLTALNIAQFSRYCNDKFHLQAKARGLKEFRKEPQIPMATVFLFMVGSLALGKRSFHQIDLFARQAEARKWVGSSRRMVLSDATLWRVLPGMDRAWLREQLAQAYVLMRKQGQDRVILPGGRPVRAAAVDGTVLGKRSASVVEILGSSPVVVDLEPWNGKGQELRRSEAVLRRVFERHGEGFVDVVLGDGAYMTQGMLRLCRQDLGTHLLVKSKELESLNILQDAQALFQAGEEFARDMERIEGVDEERGMSYQGWAGRGFHHGGFQGELKVARIEVEMLKGPRRGETERFWVVTTDLTLTGEQMRELAHQRWSIENHTFRALNGALNSKHVWTRGKHAAEAFEVLMRIMFLTFTLVLAYRAGLDEERILESRGLRRVTVAYLAECWILSLRAAAGLFAPG
jgi:hypothetical protein